MSGNKINDIDDEFVFLHSNKFTPYNHKFWVNKEKKFQNHSFLRYIL